MATDDRVASARRDRVLVVCSANQCRSPLAGALLVREVVRRGLPVDVATAGFAAVGLPVTPPTLDVARRAGLDLGGHVSRRVDQALLEGADLIVGMERQHVRESVVLVPTVWRRTFTLPDLVRRAERAAPRAAGEPLRAWAEELSAGRDRMSMLGASPEDDVRDPTTDRGVDHESTFALLEDLVIRLVNRAWPA